MCSHRIPAKVKFGLFSARTSTSQQHVPWLSPYFLEASEVPESTEANTLARNLAVTNAKERAIHSQPLADNSRG